MNQEMISGVPETMLQTLYARARETKTGRGYVNDPKAAEIVSALNYDFHNAEKDKAMRTGVVARTILLDEMTKTFLTAHPNTTVLNIACGLDTRCYRMEGLYRMWYNLDLPETMDIRRRFFRETGKIRQISGSAMDGAWAHAVEIAEGPVLIIVEGLSMYLQEEDIRRFFAILDQNFSSATVFLEVMNPWIAAHMKEKSIEGSKAKFTWGVRSGKALEPLAAPFRSVQDRSLTEGMAVFIPVYRLLGKIGCVRQISNKLLVLQK